MPLQAMLADFQEALDAMYDNDVKLLADAIRLSASTLSHRPDMLGPMIVGRLLPYYNSHDKIQNLIKQCDSDGLEVRNKYTVVALAKVLLLCENHKRDND